MSKKKDWITENWNDISMTARFVDTVWDDSPHGYEFEIYEQVGWDNNEETNKYDIPLYERKGATGDGDFSTNGLEDAQPYLTGFVKWDGCSHFYFGDDGYLHLCGIERIEQLRIVLQRLIDRARTKGVEE